MKRVAGHCVCCGGSTPSPNGSEGQGNEFLPESECQANQANSNGATMPLSGNSWQRVENCPELLRELADNIEDFSDLAAALESAGLFHGGRGGVDSVDFAVEFGPATVQASSQFTSTDRLKCILSRIQSKDDESFRRFKRTLIENGEFKAIDILQPDDEQSPSPPLMGTQPTPPWESTSGPDSVNYVGPGAADDTTTAAGAMASHVIVPRNEQQTPVQPLSEEGVRDLLRRIASFDDDSLRRFRERALLDNGTYDPIQVLLRTLQQSSTASHAEPARPNVDFLPRFIGYQRSKQSEAREEFMREEVDARASSLGTVASTSGQSGADEQLQVRAAETMVPGGPHVYSMQSHPRGLCVIFNIREFPSIPDKNRPGSDFDEQRMVRLFEAFGFNVCRHVDSKSSDILALLDTYATLNVQESHDAFVCIIMSHGEQQHVYGSDYNTVKLKSIFELFNNSNCPAMRERPKIFLIQACRGSIPDSGSSGRPDEHSSTDYLTELANSMSNPSDENCQGAQAAAADPVQSDAGMIEGTLPRAMSAAEATNAAGISAAAEAERRIPSWSDMYVAYSVIEGYESLRDLTTGSWFLKAVFDVMARDSYRYDLDTLMERVSKTVIGRYRYDGQRQCPEIRKIGWHKKLFFNPGL